MERQLWTPNRTGPDAVSNLLPNLFTTAALFAGFYAIVSAMNARFEPAAVAIVVAMVLDGADGRIARMTNTQSAIWRRIRQSGGCHFLRLGAGVDVLHLGVARPW